MRILHVSHAYPPYSIGGAELHLRDLVLTQRDRHELFILSRRGDLSVDEYTVRDEVRDGVRLRTLVNNYRAVWTQGFLRTYEDPAVIPVFEQALREFRPDVVHFQHLVTLSHELPEIARRHGVPSLLMLHDFWPLCVRANLVDWRDRPCSGPNNAKCATCVADQLGGPAPVLLRGRLIAWLRGQRGFWLAQRAAAPLMRFMVRASIRAAQRGAPNRIARRQQALRSGVLAADLVLAPSRYLRDRFVSHGFPEDRILVSHLGFPRAPSYPARPSTPGRPLRLGFIGRLIPVKGLQVLLNALRTVPRDGYTLEVYGRWGDDAAAPAYRRAMEDLSAGLPVRFHEPFPAGGAPGVLATLDLLVVPSIWPENAPLVLQEAKLAGVPLLCSDIGGIPEFVVPDRDGWLVPAGDARALADRTREIVEHPDRLAALHPDASGIRTLSDECDELDAHYRRLVAGHVPAPLA
jgi:glycosyltransferase involved in cell wall biosynthesis